MATHRLVAALTTALLAVGSLTACEPTTGGSGSRGCTFKRPNAIGAGSATAPPRVASPDDSRPRRPKPKSTKTRKANCTKQTSPVWKGFTPYKNGIRTNGKTGKDARFYEWDHTHNDIEVYGPGSSYRHLGSLDPANGKLYKGPVPGRNLQGKLK